MPKGNKKATGKKTSEPLTTMRFGSPLAHVSKLGYKKAQKIARLAANNAILKEYKNSLSNEK